MIDTIFLDMDGTLLPVDNDSFTHTYFKLLCTRVAPYGFTSKQFLHGLMCGMQAMVANDGTKTNCEAFWNEFTKLYGENAREIEPVCDNFYKNEFNKVKHILGINVNRKPLLNFLRRQGYAIVLANNPMLPPSGTNSRLDWIGLKPDDFIFVTDYSNCTYCKPNLRYYSEICTKLDKKPENCLMVGNSIKDDACAAELGLSVYIIDDYIEGDISSMPELRHGSFNDFLKYVQTLPDISHCRSDIIH